MNALPPFRATACRRARALWALLTCMLGAGAAAAQSGMNEALVAVPATTAKARVEAFPRALAQVFSKWSGQRTATAPGVGDELARAQEFVQQYRYRNYTEAGTASLLWVRFEDSAVAGAMERAGIRVWSAARPSPLLWVAKGGGQQVDLIAPDAEDGLDRVLHDAAWKRGLPLRLPLLDLEDRIRVKPEDVWGMDETVLMEASARYPAGPVVAVRLGPDAGGPWQARWWMRDAGQSQRWQSLGSDPGAALSEGMDELADRLLERHALASTVPEAVDVTVSGIRSLADYQRAMSYLGGLAVVSALAVLETRGEIVRFRLQVAGGADSLRRNVALGRVLLADDTGSGYRLGP